VTADEQALWRARAYWYLDAAAAGLGIERRTAEKSRR
jgi:hypothetical protein